MIIKPRSCEPSENVLKTNQGWDIFFSSRCTIEMCEMELIKIFGILTDMFQGRFVISFCLNWVFFFSSLSSSYISSSSPLPLHLRSERILCQNNNSFGSTGTNDHSSSVVMDPSGADSVLGQSISYGLSRQCEVIRFPKCYVRTSTLIMFVLFICLRYFPAGIWYLLAFFSAIWVLVSIFMNYFVSFRTILRLLGASATHS